MPPVLNFKELLEIRCWEWSQKMVGRSLDGVVFTTSTNYLFDMMEIILCTLYNMTRKK